MKKREFIKRLEELKNEGIKPHYSHFQMNNEKYQNCLKKYGLKENK